MNHSKTRLKVFNVGLHFARASTTPSASGKRNKQELAFEPLSGKR